MLDRPISVTMDNACRLTGMTRNQLYQAIRENKLETSFLGKRRVVIWASLEKFVESHKAGIPAAVSEQHRELRTKRTAKERAAKVAA